MERLQTRFELDLIPKYNKLGWRTFECTAGQIDTSVAGVRGSALSTYNMFPVLWSKRLIDCAKESTRFLETVRQDIVPENTNQIIIPKRKNYLAESGWEGGTGEPTADITKTEIGTRDGVALAPTDYTYLVAITYKDLRVNAVNEIQYNRDELTEFYTRKVDGLIRDQTMGDNNSTEGSLTAAPTPMSNSVAGAQTILGGDATMADNSLDPTDILTTDMMRKAIRMLSSKIGFYWSNTTTHGKSAVAKNPWDSTKAEPFVFFIAPEQREALQGESQFTNASEYGSDTVVMTGEIGEYLGAKVVVTPRCTSFANADYVYLDGTINPLMDTDGHIAMLCKAFKYGALAWGQKPAIKVFDFPTVAEVRMMLHLAVATDEVHPDAIVRMLVTDA